MACLLLFVKNRCLLATQTPIQRFLASVAASQDFNTKRNDKISLELITAFHGSDKQT